MLTYLSAEISRRPTMGVIVEAPPLEVRAIIRAARAGTGARAGRQLERARCPWPPSGRAEVGRPSCGFHCFPESQPARLSRSSQFATTTIKSAALTKPGALCVDFTWTLFKGKGVTRETIHRPASSNNNNNNRLMLFSAPTAVIITLGVV